MDFLGFIVAVVVALCIVGLVLWVVKRAPMLTDVYPFIQWFVISVVGIWLLCMLIGWAPIPHFHFLGGGRS